MHDKSSSANLPVSSGEMPEPQNEMTGDKEGGLLRDIGANQATMVDRWVEALWPWLENDLRFPITVEEHKTYWRIEMFGAVRIDLDRDHRGYRVAGRTSEGFNQHGDLRLRSMLATQDWLCSWIWRRAHRTSLDLVALSKCLKEVASALRARIPHQTIYAARMAIRAALPLDAEILALAGRSNPLPILGLRHYCAVARHREELLRREKLAPALLPVFQSYERFTEFGYRVGCGRLKEYAIGGGMSVGGWRVLLRNGAALWRALRRTHEFYRRPEHVLRDWANIMALLPRRDALPPDRIALAWAQTYSMRSNRRDGDTQAQAHLVMAAWRRWDDLGSRLEQRHWSREELLPVLAWSQSQSHKPPQAPTNAGFSWYLRALHAVDAETVVQELNARHPGAPDLDIEFETLRFTRLGSRASLFRAGLRFRNCLTQVPNNYDGVVSPGTYYAVSDAASGRALALLRADADAEGRPMTLLELHGPCNQPVPSDFSNTVARFTRRNLALRQAARGCAHREIQHEAPDAPLQSPAHDEE